jgi:hypothetical protein
LGLRARLQVAGLPMPRAVARPFSAYVALVDQRIAAAIPEPIAPSPTEGCP